MDDRCNQGVGRERVRTAALLSGNVLGVMLLAVLNPSLPNLARHFGGGAHAEFLTRVALLAPAIMIALCSPPSGWIADRAGRRALMLGSIAVFGIAGCLGALAPNLDVLIGLRLLQGAGAAGLINAAAILAGDYYMGVARERMLAWQAAAIGGGAVVFLLLGGVLATLEWRAPFFLYFVASAVALPLVWVAIDEPKGVADRAALIAPSLAADARLRWGTLAAFCSALMFLPTAHAPFLLAGRGFGAPDLVGPALAALSGAGALSSLAFAWLKTRIGSRGVFAIIFGSAAIGAAVMAAFPPYWATLAGMAVFGIGVGLVMPNLLSSAFSNSDQPARAAIVSVVNTGIFSGEAAAPFLSEPVRLALGAPGVFAVSAAIALAAGSFAVLTAKQAHSS